ncbi:MAG TPA: hypothetical protein DF282_06090 [Hyphomonas sp.]|jgi:hypothetical protein|uniref:hypothetical protein n=1 Tax=unclassified Hyphomonas TaxID=2630699 RepID=UPI000C961FED|nr:hypothetical protein [Hyphomonas sp.]MAL45175.1 hypothetical protein [Hyphomonas sp.]HAW55478.1 hypothetical protein [Hyphomonas sp.]HBJ40060.1 hypothetical protein [Hyphomonas sp.]HBT36507.1 hypothetical protein [Hyphomonas sp.]HCE22070.1 hypothetical protein [Hyphomonas sp.]|tara:strand:+ start:1665 stop:1931 length:267 start_codon:yes stop_codon:yes gene_type:complete
MALEMIKVAVAAPAKLATSVNSINVDVSDINQWTHVAFMRIHHTLTCTEINLWWVLVPVPSRGFEKLDFDIWSDDFYVLSFFPWKAGL